MRRGALRRVIVVFAFGALGLGGFETVAHGDLLPPLPTTTVTVPVPPTLPPLPTSTTVPLPPITTATVRLPTTTTPTTTVRVPPPPTTTVRLPTTSTTVPLPTTTVRVPVPTTTAPVRLPTTTSPGATSTSAQSGGAVPVGAGSGQPPSAPGAAGAASSSATATARTAGGRGIRPISGPALEAVKAGAKPALRHTRAQRARARATGRKLPVLRATQVSARTSGLAAFYAGLQKALANDTTSVVDGGTSRQFMWPTAVADGGVLSRTGALVLAFALFAVALLLAFSLLPRLAAIGFLPVSRTAAQVARESSLVALGAIAVCALLAVLLLRIAL